MRYGPSYDLDNPKDGWHIAATGDKDDFAEVNLCLAEKKMRC